LNKINARIDKQIERDNSLASRINKLEKELIDTKTDMSILSHLVAEVSDYKSLLERIVSFAPIFLPAETIYVVDVIEADSEERKIKLAFHSDRSVYSSDEKEISWNTFIGSAIKAKTAMIISGPQEKGKFKVASDPNKLNNAIAVPMIGVEGNAMGAIIWQNKLVGDFKSPFDKQRVVNFVRTSASAVELAKLVEQFRYLADYDQMTGLIRRDRLAYFVEELISNRRFGPWMHFVIIDLDGFKAINDRFGHTAGDELIKVCADYLKDSCTADNVVCSHWGGDEFAFATVSYSKDEGSEFADGIRCGISLAAKKWVEGKGLEECNLTASAGGCSIIRKDNVNYDMLVKHADSHLLVSKGKGKNQITWKIL
jgi:diguanylate cyclase (GGDEF)-like protein